MSNSREEKPVIIYTDGSCDPNPGPGGWAALIISNAKKIMLADFEAETTNNRMELQAAIQALKSLKTKESIILYTDSQYLRKGITEWMENWISRGWKRKGGRLANVDLWKDILKEIQKHKIEWQWVKAHDGNQYNEQVDRKARQMANTGRKKR